MAGDQRHLHDPEKAAEFARALGLMVGGHHPFVGDWQVKGLYAYRSGKYKGQAYFGTGGSESDRLKDTYDPSTIRSQIDPATAMGAIDFDLDVHHVITQTMLDMNPLVVRTAARAESYKTKHRLHQGPAW